MAENLVKIDITDPSKSPVIDIYSLLKQVVDELPQEQIEKLLRSIGVEEKITNYVIQRFCGEDPDGRYGFSEREKIVSVLGKMEKYLVSQLKWSAVYGFYGLVGVLETDYDKAKRIVGRPEDYSEKGVLKAQKLLAVSAKNTIQAMLNKLVSVMEKRTETQD